MKKKVNIIESVVDNRKIRVAGYARVSSKSDEQLTSFHSQVAYYTQYIQNMDNAILIEIYADEGVTGTEVSKRDGFQRMIEDCRLGKIDKIITKSIDRFGRNIVETLEVVRELKDLGVSIFFEEENMDTLESTSETVLSLRALKAEWESRNISYSKKWGFRTRAAKGIYNQSNLPYGYFKENEIIKVDEKKSEIVRMIFDMFVNLDMSMSAIVRYLNEHEVENISWSKERIKYMLTNERYCGDMLLQKSFTSDEFPFKRYKNRGDISQFYVQDVFPKIIERDIYDASVNKHRKFLETLSENQILCQGKYLYTSIIKCEECGSTFRRRIRRKQECWSCCQHLEDKTKCNVKDIQKSELDEAFLRIFCKLKNSIDILTEYGKGLEEIGMDPVVEDKLEEIEQNLVSLPAKKKEILQKNLRGEIDEANKISQLNQLVNQKNVYKLEKSKLLNSVHELKKIVQNNEIIDCLEKTPYLKEVDEFVLKTLVKEITINENEIQFMLCNDLKIKIKRRIFHGNYS